jgi:methylated-DNA-[protein]-cysteine S-methyltransferase
MNTRRKPNAPSSPAPAGPEPTDFQQRVYALTRTIPRGRVATYGALARALGIASARAVGQALRRNPWAPVVPCHRVIASDGTVGGFQGADGGPSVASKLRMLAREGVRFDRGSGRIAEPERMLRELPVRDR